MKLTDLDAHFVGNIQPDKSYWRVGTLAEAQGVMFQCPKCAVGKERGDGFVRGAHFVICWFRDRGVPDDFDPKPGRWTPSGADLRDLTFIPGVPPVAKSVLLTIGCRWHGYVENGEATIIKDPA